MAVQCNWINERGVQCGQPMGHACEHSNGLLTTPRDTWHEFIGASRSVGPPVVKQGHIWTVNSCIPQCLWMGTAGRCIFEIGHTVEHKDYL
jgi:hypothetical protein